LAHLREIPFDAAAAREAARVRIDLERRGLLIGPLDLLIAGTALSRGATLVTSNVGEFRRIRGLRLEDWSRDAER
jgi:tRNA(fMet)-specific endonuclease VapC